MGRDSKYTPERVQEIIDLLSAGCLVKDVCAKVGISQKTFYEWRADPDKGEFSESIDRAQAQALVNATVVLRRSMAPYDEVTESTKTMSETRLRRGKAGAQVPFTYTRTEQTHATTHHLGDWRAALEYLKRRDSANWAEKLIVEITPEFADLCKTMGLTPSEAIKQFEEMLRATHEAEIVNAASHPPND